MGHLAEKKRMSNLRGSKLWRLQGAKVTRGQPLTIGAPKGGRVDHNWTTPSKEDRICYLMWVTPPRG